MTELAGHLVASGIEVVFTGPGRRHNVALGPLDLELLPGTFTSIIGPSGCGKTTFLNVIGGFIAPTLGTMTLDGLPVRGPSARQGVVFQQYALFPWLTAQGNVEFALKRFGYSKARRRAEAKTWLDEVGLADKADVYPGQLSGGMRQRVALARTLAALPTILLMDEPFGALDAQTRALMHQLLLVVCEKHRPTVLFITHDVDEALLLSDCVHVMSAAPGRLVDRINPDRNTARVTGSYFRGHISDRTRILSHLTTHLVATEKGY